MRIRSTKPEFWRSDRIAAVSWDARLVLKGLESYVDDNGVGKDDRELIVGDLFMRDLVREPSRTLARVSEAISELHQAGLVWRYAHEGTDLLYLAFWESIQRIDKPQAGRFPRPDGTLNYRDSQIRECVAKSSDSSRTLAPGTGEQGNRGTGEQTPPSAPADAPTSTLDDDFAEWWDLYPRKVGKASARRKYEAARKHTSVDQLLDGLRSQLPAMQSSDPKFVPHPDTWLNQGRWEDEIENTDSSPDEGGWFQPFTPPPAPPEIADDPAAYQQFVAEAAAEWRAGGNRG